MQGRFQPLTQRHGRTVVELATKSSNGLNGRMLMMKAGSSTRHPRLQADLGAQALLDVQCLSDAVSAVCHGLPVTCAQVLT